MVCLSEFGNLLVDLPFVLMAVVTTVTPWGRGIWLWRQIANAVSQRSKKKPQNKQSLNALYSDLRKICFVQFICALLDLPTIIASLFILVTVWNASALMHYVKVYCVTVMSCFIVNKNRSDIRLPIKVDSRFMHKSSIFC